MENLIGIMGNHSATYNLFHIIELHWLPVEKQIVFKILLLTFKCLHGLAPSYPAHGVF